MDINNPKIKEEVERLVQEILAGQASADASTKIEAALNDASATIEELKERTCVLKKQADESIAAKEEVETAKASLETDLQAFKEQVEALTEKNRELEERASKAESTLDGIKKDQTAEKRMEELSSLKVARVSEEAFSAQKELVREMTDEEFSSYRDDRVAVREELLTSVAQEIAVASSGSKVEEPTSVGDEGAAGEELTPPADIESALETASAAVPNASSVSKGKDWRKFTDDFTAYMESLRGEKSENME